MRDSEQRRPAIAAAGRPARRDLHAARARHRALLAWVDRAATADAVPGRAGRRDAVPAADRHPGGDHRLGLARGAAGHHHPRPGRAREGRHCRMAIFDKTGTLTYGQPN